MYNLNTSGYSTWNPLMCFPNKSNLGGLLNNKMVYILSTMDAAYLEFVKNHQISKTLLDQPVQSADEGYDYFTDSPDVGLSPPNHFIFPIFYFLFKIQTLLDIWCQKRI